jgi:hypothetical protein
MGHVWTAPAVQEESDLSAKRSGAAMYAACFSRTAKPSDANKATRASGSLATFVSLTILPYASTTHTLESSNETSIPA